MEVITIAAWPLVAGSLLVVTVFGALAPAPVYGQGTTISVETPQAPPEWALLQRELLRSGSIAIEQYAIVSQQAGVKRGNCSNLFSLLRGMTS